MIRIFSGNKKAEMWKLLFLVTVPKS